MDAPDAFEGLFVRAFLICSSDDETAHGRTLHVLAELPFKHEGFEINKVLRAHIAISRNGDKDGAFRLIWVRPDGSKLIRREETALPPDETFSISEPVNFRAIAHAGDVHRLLLVIGDRVLAWTPLRLVKAKGPGSRSNIVH